MLQYIQVLSISIKYKYKYIINQEFFHLSIYLSIEEKPPFFFKKPFFLSKGREKKEMKERNEMKNEMK